MSCHCVQGLTFVSVRENHISLKLLLSNFKSVAILLPLHFNVTVCHFKEMVKI